MTDEETEEAFRRMMEGEEFPEGEADVVINVSALSDLDLSTRYNDAREELLASAEMLEARTERGRELHSVRAACLVEMTKRGMR